ncbi:MAG: hypothetical protein LBL04_02890 [Bacteroidales bacterium]|jgi:predicted glycosyltransferase involved in capsule biosynthesis|nr:hypothetical protein [Bacteroidales bacterium]
MKIDLTDVTFLILVRLDSVERLENTVSVVSFLYKKYNTHIMILEVSAYNNGILKNVLKNKIEYIYYKDSDVIFHKTRFYNMMTKRVKTPVLALWDADVIADYRQIEDSISKLRNGDADIVFPYDGFLDVSMIIRNLYLQKKNVKLLHHYKEWMDLKYGSNFIGGAFFANKEKYINAGMENENFYGWGNADYERFHRWEKLKYKIHRSKGALYHLSHPRDLNGKYRSTQQYQTTVNYLQKTIASSDSEILNDISLFNASEEILS